MQKQSLFEYSVLFHPKPTKEQREADESPRSVLIVPPTPLLAFDDKEVGMKAAREIPDNYADKLDCVEVVIRPF
jgi:hypothetical protein